MVAHPLDSEDIVVEMQNPSFVARVRHSPTELEGWGAGDSEEAAIEAAKDDLLKQLEEMGGC